MSGRTNKIPSVLAWLGIMAISWLIWSGLYKPLVIGLGLFSCILTVYVSYRLGFFKHSTALHILPRILGYWIKLFIEVIKSSIDVTKIVLDPKLPISPTEVTMKAAPKGMIGQVILGNSITLSPGTVTIDVHEDVLRIHCLTQESAHALIESGINEDTAKLTDK